MILDIPAAVFIAWLRQVTPATVVGDRPAHLYLPSYTHPLAMWLSAHLGLLCGVYLNPDNRLVVSMERQPGRVEVQRLLPWAERFYAQTCYAAGQLTGSDCLWGLREVVYGAA